MTPSQRLPWAPLVPHLPASPADAIQVLGITFRSLHRYRTEGIPARQADRLAVAAGTHSLNVWGLAWTWALDEIAPPTHLSEVA